MLCLSLLRTASISAPSRHCVGLALSPHTLHFAIFASFELACPKITLFVDRCDQARSLSQRCARMVSRGPQGEYTSIALEFTFQTAMRVDRKGWVCALNDEQIHEIIQTVKRRLRSEPTVSLCACGGERWMLLVISSGQW